MTVRGFLIIERQNAHVVFKGVRKHCYKCAYHARARGGRARRAYLLSRRKNESGEHACNRLSECMGNRSGEHAGGARGSKRNDWTDNHAKARAGKWLKRE